LSEATYSGALVFLGMPAVTNSELIAKAASVLKPKQIGKHLMGDVACALLTNNGNVYKGVCIETFGGMGFCAEQNAMGAMITCGEWKIEKIVAVWRNAEGMLFVGAPCGRYREFMRQIDERNLDTDIVLGTERTVKLRELLPNYEWWTEQVHGM
jgi:cytidine deaminase